MALKFTPCLIVVVVVLVKLSSAIVQEQQVGLPAESEPDRMVSVNPVPWPGMFPYTVYVETRARKKSCEKDGFVCPYCTSKKYEYCTGILLTLSWVATNFRCFDKSKFTPPDMVANVIAGDNLLGQETYYEQVRRSEHHVLLEEAANISSEIVILKVLEPFDETEFVQPITIAKDPVPVGTKCYMVGYGQPYYEEEEFKDKKMRWSYGIKRWGTCTPEENIFCVQPFEERRGPCKGDMGGPFVCGKGLLGGMYVDTLPPGHKCVFDFDSHLAIYTYLRLGYHEDWLREHIPDLPAFQEFPPDVTLKDPLSKPPREEVRKNKPKGKSDERGSDHGSQHVANTWLILATYILLQHVANTWAQHG